MTGTAKPQPLRKQNHPHALAARARKQAEAAAIGVDAAHIDDFVEAFYGKVRADAVLGPIFAARIADWGPHLARMKTFWRSILLNSGEYSGNPMRQHLAMTELDEAHFARWLTLFYATLDELGKADAARRLVGDKARMIATSLLLGIAGRGGVLPAATVGQSLPHMGAGWPAT